MNACDKYDCRVFPYTVASVHSDFLPYFTAIRMFYVYIYIIYWISHDLSRNRQPQNQMMHDDLSCSNPQKGGNTKVEWNQIPKIVIDFDRCCIMCIIYNVPHEQMFMPSKELRTAVAPRETAVLSAPNHWSSSQAGSLHSSYPLHKNDSNVGNPMP